MTDTALITRNEATALTVPQEFIAKSWEKYHMYRDWETDRKSVV